MSEAWVSGRSPGFGFDEQLAGVFARESSPTRRHEIKTWFATPAPTRLLWPLLGDVARWPQWLSWLSWVQLPYSRPQARGRAGLLGLPVARLRVLSLTPGRAITVSFVWPLAAMDIERRLVRTHPDRQVLERLAFRGVLAGPLFARLGPRISRSYPHDLAMLISRAAQIAEPSELIEPPLS